MSQLQIILAPIFALMVMAFLFNAVLRKFHGSKYEQPMLGVLFGTALVVGMTNPITIGEGLIVDARTLLVAAATVFGGPIAGLVTMVFGLAARAYLGGAGLTAGLIGLLLAYGMALLWQMKVQHLIRNRVLADALAGMFVTGSIIALFVLPFPIAMQIMMQVLPTLIVTNTFGMVAIGFIYRREVKYFEDARLLAAYAKTDPLTKTLNRRGLDRAFDEAAKARKDGHAMLYFDIDNFKGINDTYGHDAGDKALEVIADRVTQCVRGEAVFARHGGDEFSIYLPGVHPSDLNIIADRLCRLIASSPIAHKDTLFTTSISMGGYWTAEDISLQALIDYANRQLLRAKKMGKNRAVVATAEEVEMASAVA
ncbi:MAG: diguanylate cyclase [Pseudomonadota bacterium]